MGKQKQQVISRFFAPKPTLQTAPPPPATTSPSPSPSPSPPPPPSSSSSSPKISTTVSFSPAKRKLLSSHLFSSSPKKAKILTSNPSLHKKFLQKLLEPNIPPPDPSPQLQKYTPLEQQVANLKTNHPDVILMIEVGYKYRFFGEDAEIAARVLGIYAHVNHNFLTASIPTFRLNVHVRRLVSAGYKVGVVKQTETAAIKAHGENKAGPFSRGLLALYTKATLEAAEGVGGVREEECGRESNYLCCIVERSVDCHGVDVRVGFVGIEVSTGDVVYGEFSDGVLRNGVEALVLSLAPAELLLVGNLSKHTEKLLLAYAGPASNVRVERVPGNCFNDGGALAELMSLYEKMSMDSLINTEDIAEQGFHHTAVEGIMNMPDLAVQAFALTIRHLKQFGLERILCLGTSFRPFSNNMEMHLSANTIEQLEVLRNNASRSESGSLLYLMNNTLTIYGSRLLRHWVTHPLCSKNMILARLDAVSEIAESMGSYKTSQSFGDLDEKDNDATIIQPDFYCVLSALLTTLGRSPDIQRGITRIFHRTATASEFIAVIQTILYAGKQLQRLDIEGEHNCDRVQKIHVHSTLLKKLIQIASSSSVIGSAAKLISTLNKEAAEQGDLPNLIVASDDQFAEVARARKTVHLARERLDSLIGLCRKQLGKRNLEFVSVSGATHLIELPSDVKVPSNWVKVNSTKKMIRYHPPEVLNALDQLSLANEETMIVCRAAWDSFLRDFGRYYAEFQGCVHALAALDCLHSLATLSKNKNYVRPLFVDDDEPLQIHVDSGRHPVLETILQDNFVPNDTCLHADKEFCQIVTGPNMGGKSCYIRQVALIAIMAQVGSFVPASSAKLHVVDGIYTRMGASDSIQQGRSTFLEELSEASHILRKCTARSLVIIDELGRGTSTHDGGAIAYATLHHLLSPKRCMVLFVTHYPKIADIINEFPGSVGAYHVSYLTSERNMSPMDREFENEDITYLYKLVPGVSEKSFGFKVAQLAQLPSSCIRRAIVMAARLEEVISRRTGDGLGRVQLLQTLPSDQPVAQETTSESFNFCRGMTTVSTSGGLNDTFRSFLMNLNTERLDVERDSAESFQFLESARNIAKELIRQI